jgi:hypothetical protein
MNHELEFITLVLGKISPKQSVLWFFLFPFSAKFVGSSSVSEITENILHRNKSKLET